MYIDQIGAFLPLPASLNPSGGPTSAPTTFPTLLYDTSVNYPSSLPESVTIKFGVVTDHSNGNYTATICPTLTGVFEVQVLLNGDGVSNQPYTLSDKNTNVYTDNAMGEGTYKGQYMGQSPYPLVVTAGDPAGMYSTVYGSGIVNATVGVPAYFTVTVRDSWANLVTASAVQVNISVYLPSSPYVVALVSNLHNGSYYVTYTPTLTGAHPLHIIINGSEVANSPFTVYTLDGQINANYTRILGPSLRKSTAGMSFYFEIQAHDIDDNLKSNTNSIFIYKTSGSNNSTGYLIPCSNYTHTNTHTNTVTTATVYNSVEVPSICMTNFSLLNNSYYGIITPTIVGETYVHVYLLTNGSTNNSSNSSVVEVEIGYSPFILSVVPSYAVAANAYVQGKNVCLS